MTFDVALPRCAPYAISSASRRVVIPSNNKVRANSRGDSSRLTPNSLSLAMMTFSSAKRKSTSKSKRGRGRSLALRFDGLLIVGLSFTTSAFTRRSSAHTKTALANVVMRWACSKASLLSGVSGARCRRQTRWLAGVAEQLLCSEYQRRVVTSLSISDHIDLDCA